MNMNCTDIKTHIDDYFDDRLSQIEKRAFEQHVSICSECSNNYEVRSMMLQELKNLPVAEPKAGFESRMFAEVRRQHREGHRNRFAAGFVTAMAASVLLWFVSMIYMPQNLNTQPEVISLAMNDVQTVSLSFDAVSDIESVNLSIGLPKNVEIDGYPGKKELAWKTRLQKGQNILALPVMAVDKGQGELVAQLSYGDKVKTFRIVLKTRDDKVLNYSIQPAYSV